ncbi:facilitated trehalose transporter Tret1-like [Plodia interpunctella]|uniref:facilitated trehalose transporter Tret1-like n=1 Tax=Plodia interpunctella TaxID=58824 RepID=UPI002367D2BB|nr:facilitated trehalose transporter Tret1-like [Plodia interpunctella]
MKISCVFSTNVFRQVLAAVATSLYGISAGIVFAYSAVLLPQLKDDDRIDYDAKYDTWIASISTLTMAFGCFVAGPFIDRYGRRIGLILLAIPFVFSWLIMGLGSNIYLLLLGRAVAGICAGLFRTMSIVYLSEVTDPKHRSMMLISISLSLNIGILVSHSAGTYLYWRTASYVFCIPNILPVIILVYLKESPLWLITKGKIQDGTDFFYWFRAKSDVADRELSAAICKQKHKSQDLNVKETIKVVFSRPFMVPFSICFLVFTQTQFCGTNVFNFYAPDLIKQTFSNNVDNFLIMVLIDFIRVCGTGSIFFTVKHVPRRFLYCLCSIVTTFCILFLAAYLYYQSSNLLWFGMTSLVMYIYFSITFMSIGWSFISEMFPSSVRGLGSASTASTSFLLLFIAVKMTPSVIDAFGMEVYYIICACITAVCTIILYFVLPETNGKTLQEIEHDFIKDKCNKELSNEQTKF